MASRMVRELADVPDEVRAVPAPPLPVLTEPYSMRFLDPDANDATTTHGDAAYRHSGFGSRTARRFAVMPM